MCNCGKGKKARKIVNSIFQKPKIVETMESKILKPDLVQERYEAFRRDRYLEQLQEVVANIMQNASVKALINKDGVSVIKYDDESEKQLAVIRENMSGHIKSKYPDLVQNEPKSY